MKKVWMAQPTNMLADSIFLPYAVGAIAAYAWKLPEISETYELQPFLFLKEPVDVVLREIDAPYLVAFSCYMWNVEYNLSLAHAIKAQWPECLIVFGGPDIPRDLSYLKQYPWIDILLFGEGEKTFSSLLLELEVGSLSGGLSVDNIAYRTKTELVLTKTAPAGPLTDYPSPYTEGCFDSILNDKRFQNIQLDAIIETNRGCPYQCIYCSWGDRDNSLRPFPMEKVKNELKWFSDHKIAYCVCADGNFGLLPRDEEIAEYVVQLKKETGFPLKFETTSAKNKGESVFRINCLLDSAGLNRGVSVSCQSLSEDVLKIIGRKNMSFASFSSELKKYRDAGVATYTDLILGLPGETFQSFCKGLFSVIEAGQHEAVNISRCELLPNSPMFETEVIACYGIKTIKSHLCQNHSIINQDKMPGSRSEIVVETNTMTSNDWQRMCRISSCVHGFHFLGLLRYIAIFMRQTYDISYYDFYMRLYNYIEAGNGFLSRTVNYVNRTIDMFLQHKSNIFFADPRFGDIYFPLEEGLFLCCTSEHERFYKEIASFLSMLINDADLQSELLLFQKSMINLPGIGEHTECFSYDWLSYFERIYDPLPRFPERINCRYMFRPERYDDLKDYAREIVWFGKRNKKSTVSAIRI